MQKQKAKNVINKRAAKELEEKGVFKVSTTAEWKTPVDLAVYGTWVPRMKGQFKGVSGA